MVWSNSRLLWRRFALVGVVCMLSSCSMRKSKELLNLSTCAHGYNQSFEGSQAEPSNDSSCSDDFLYDALACEAKLSDVPVPLGSCPLPYYFDEKNLNEGQDILLGYMSQQDEDSLLTFYEREMFANGWRLLACIKGSDSVLIFEKPDRICAIIIGSYNIQEAMAGYNKLVIAVGHRSLENDD